MSAIDRTPYASLIAVHLDELLPNLTRIVVSLYWPFRGEPDLRNWADAIRARGAICALPVVVGKNAPLIFRFWGPGEPLARGVWNIPIPADGAQLTPDVVIAPVVGFDRQGYRLGYGGAFFDRTPLRSVEKATRHRRRLQPSGDCDDISAFTRHSDGRDRY